MRRSLRATLILLALSPGAPTLARAALSDGTWWVAADGVIGQPSNLNLEAAIADRGAYARGGEVFNIGFDPTFSGRLRFGWRAAEGENSYLASWWVWQGDETIGSGGGVIPTLSDPGYTANDFSNSFESHANVRANILDLLLSRRITGGKKGSFHWTTGLRHAEFEQHWDTDYFEPDPTIPLNREEHVRVDVDGKATGVTLGVAGTYQWAKRWRTIARAQIALLKGSMDSRYVDTDFRSLGPPFTKTAIFQEGPDRINQQLELEARVSFNVWEGLDVSLGWWLLNWSDVNQVDRWMDFSGAPSFTRQGVAFDGWVIGVAYAFP